MNQFSNKSLLIAHFPGLWNILVESSFQVIPYLTWKWFEFIIFFYWTKFISYFHNDLKDIKDQI